MKSLSYPLTQCFSTPTALALGTFDGLHLGHKAVMDCALRSGLPAVSVCIVPDKPRGKSLLLPAEKSKLLQSFGVAYDLPIPLEAIRDLSPEEFFYEILIKRLNAGLIACGFNFRFGKNAAGDSTLLKALCEQQGIGFLETPAMKYDSAPISSTRIRTALAAGDVEAANRMLGRPFSVTLPVIHGKALGHKLGFPTANQAWPETLTVPRFGVYAVKATVEGNTHTGVCNIGLKPTVGSDTILAETHLLHFAQDVYDKPLTIELLAFLRPEEKFDSMESLMAAIGENARQAQYLTKEERP